MIWSKSSHIYGTPYTLLKYTPVYKGPSHIELSTYLRNIQEFHLNGEKHILEVQFLKLITNAKLTIFTVCNK